MTIILCFYGKNLAISLKKEDFFSFGGGGVFVVFSCFFLSFCFRTVTFLEKENRPCKKNPFIHRGYFSYKDEFSGTAALSGSIFPCSGMSHEVAAKGER